MWHKFGRARTKLFGVLLVVIVTLVTAPLQARQIVDMYHNRVNVPDKINHIFIASATANFLVYAIDPSLPLGLNWRLQEAQKPYFAKSYQALPVLGGMPGDGMTMNFESVLKVKPDIILLYGSDGAFSQRSLQELRGLHIPIVAIDVGSITKYPETLEFLGKLLHREKRAAALAAYTRKTLKELAATTARIPPQQRVSVFNTHMMGMFTTACDGSWHAELIPLAGGRNAARCTSKNYNGVERVDMERILAMNPDVIVTMSPMVAAKMKQDPSWRDVKAVKTHRVYLTPSLPLNWFDAPPSFMEILGVQWLAHCLYPDLYRKDITQEAQHFMQLFFNLNLSREEIGKIMNNQ